MNYRPWNLPPGYIPTAADSATAPSPADSQPQLSHAQGLELVQRHRRMQVELERLCAHEQSVSPPQSTPTHSAPPDRSSMPAPAPLEHAFPPSHVQPRVANMAARNNSALPMAQSEPGIPHQVQPRMGVLNPHPNGISSARYHLIPPTGSAYRPRSQAQARLPTAPSLRGGAQDPEDLRMPRQAHPAKPAKPPTASRKRTADVLDQSDRRDSAVPTPPPKKQKSKADKVIATPAVEVKGKLTIIDLSSPPRKRTSAAKQSRGASAGQMTRTPVADATPLVAEKSRGFRKLVRTVPAQTGGKEVVPPKEKRRVESEERDATYCEEEEESDGEEVVPPKRKRRAGTSEERDATYHDEEEASEYGETSEQEQDTALPSIEHRTPSPAPQAATTTTYHLSTTLLNLRRAISESNWNEYVHLVEQFVHGKIEEPALVRGQRGIFQGQSLGIERRCRKCVEGMVRGAVGRNDGGD